MKFNMIVLITSCDPNRAFKTPGMPPQIAPAPISGDEAQRNQNEPRQIRNRRIHNVAARRPDKDTAKLNANPGRGKRCYIQLSLGADVKQATTKRDALRPGR